MAAKDISLVGATFYAVPQVDLPISGGGTASFVEISDTTATAADVASGKYFYTAAGVKTEGTASGGTANIEELTVTQNGTYTASGNVDGYSPVIVNVSGGGGDSWSWMGENPTKVKTYTAKVYLKDTGYATWTPSTTSTQIVAQGTLASYTGDFNNYDYVLWTKFHSHFEYGAGATGKSQLQDLYYTISSDLYSYATNYSNIAANTYNAATSGAIYSVGGMFYLNATGVQSYTASYSAGVKPYNAPSPTISYSTGSITPYVPRLDAQCSTSYFSTANATAVDQNTSYYEYQIELWQVDKETSNVGKVRATLRDMWLNGIS